jgi:hypothetical protein
VRFFVEVNGDIRHLKLHVDVSSNFHINL